ncbi:lactase-phlorizin hydrolase-like, partial [Homalodisca vitripennis]|uniref:lactase-phlorizin hydrolase-like n=1 Tax=Homalodisca vitripennis TaxID=197043 RepID=UPI001EEBB6E3
WNLCSHPHFLKEKETTPKIVRERVDYNSKREGAVLFHALPTFTKEEIEEIKGSSDFFGLNHYTSRYATSGLVGPDPSLDRDSGSVLSCDPAWKTAKIIVVKEYNNPPVFVTENGYSSDGALDDVDRIQERFGIHNVDFSDSKTAPREKRKSVGNKLQETAMQDRELLGPTVTREDLWSANRQTAGDIFADTCKELNKIEEMSSSCTFPPDFLIGCASASYQVEGGWNADVVFCSSWRPAFQQSRKTLKTHDERAAGGKSSSPGPRQFEKSNLSQHVVPWGFRALLNRIRTEYNNPPVFVFENGYSSDGALNDVDRIQYFHDYLEQMLKALHEDGCNIIGYTVWSIMDNFEWLGGYSERFGIHSVDFNDPKRPRQKRQSAEYFRKLMQTRQLPNV